VIEAKHLSDFQNRNRAPVTLDLESRQVLMYKLRKFLAGGVNRNEGCTFKSPMDLDRASIPQIDAIPHLRALAEAGMRIEHERVQRSNDKEYDGHERFPLVAPGSSTLKRPRQDSGHGSSRTASASPPRLLPSSWQTRTSPLRQVTSPLRQVTSAPGPAPSPPRPTPSPPHSVPFPPRQGSRRQQTGSGGPRRLKTIQATTSWRH